MNITRHNYEEFFLLLADGELTPAEQEEVLQFTQQHPDLEEELGILMDCRLEADTAPLYPKEKLFKPIAWDVDQPEPVQLQLLDLLDDELEAGQKLELEQEIANTPALKLEWETLSRTAKLEPAERPDFPKEKLLKPTIWNIDQPDSVYVQMMNLLDNELASPEKEILEKKITSDKALAKEWESLQKAKIVSENVLFADKASLYREKENRRIIPWVRWAAAAAVIIGLSVYLVPKMLTGVSGITKGKDYTDLDKSGKRQSEPNQNINQGQPSTKSVNTDTTRPKVEIAQKQAPGQPEENSVKSVVSGENATTTTAYNLNKAKEANKGKSSNSVTNGAVNSQITNREPDNIALVKNDIPDDGRVISRKSAIIYVSDDQDQAAPPPGQLKRVNQPKNNNTIFRTASYPDVTEDNTGDDEIVYVAGARINKQKVRGVFRGITRSLGRSFTKSKVEPDQTQSLSRSL